MKFIDIDGQMLSPVVAKAIAIRRHEEQGGDMQEMVGIICRLDREEDAREMFTDISGIECFTAEA